MNRREFLLKTSLAAAGVGISSGGCGGTAVVARGNAVAGVSCSRHPRVVQTLGDWRFQMDAFDIGEKEQWYSDGFERTDWAKVEVPKAWDCYEEALWGYEGVGWYCVSIAPQLVQSAMIHRLIFWRVNYCTKVWLNGRFLGENIDGYLPFEFDITEHLKPDAPNHLVLRVDNKPRIEWLPAASNIEWMQFGGILQPVDLVVTHPTYITDIIVNAVPESGGAVVRCTVEVENHRSQPGQAELLVNIPGSPAKSASKIQCAPHSKMKVDVELTIPNARCWSPDTPVLYTLNAVLHQNGRTVDDLSQRFGVRKIEVQGKRILLNGKELKIKGVNRYDFYGKLGPNPPRTLVIEDLRMIKKTGVNLIRVHYPNSPETLSLFDEMGFLMMEELPLNWWGQDWWGKGAQQDIGILAPACAALEKMIRRDKNHPCIIIWSMCNECATNNEIGITVMRELIKQTKELDKTRLVTFVANANAREHLAFDQADIVCFNSYYGIFMGEKCHHFAQLDSLVRAPSQRDIEQQRRHFDKPIIITEFGTRGIKGVRGDIHYSEDFQSKCIEKVWEAINNVPDISGGVLWCWRDYYHRRDFIEYATFGPYGVLTVDHKPKMSLASLAQMFSDSA
jgi:beta-galactosidase/beta-glucuronidase